MSKQDLKLQLDEAEGYAAELTFNRRTQEDAGKITAYLKNLLENNQKFESYAFPIKSEAGYGHFMLYAYSIPKEKERAEAIEFGSPHFPVEGKSTARGAWVEIRREANKINTYFTYSDDVKHVRLKINYPPLDNITIKRIEAIVLP